MNENLKPLEIEIDKYSPYYYAGASGDFNPIHIDNDFAKMAGLGGVILQGLCTMAYSYRAVMGNKPPEKIKKLKVRFRGMVRPQDKITIKSTAAKTEKNLITYDLSAENQKNEAIITNGLAIVEI